MTFRYGDYNMAMYMRCAVSYQTRVHLEYDWNEAVTRYRNVAVDLWNFKNLIIVTTKQRNFRKKFSTMHELLGTLDFCC